MHLTVLIGLLLAFTCAAGASLGGLWKQKGAVHCQSVDIRRPKESAVALFRSKWFMIGWLAAVVAWLLHIGALALAPISLGQAVISGGIVLVGILAERFFDFKLQRRQWVGLGVLALGMGVLGATAHSESNHTTYGILALSFFELLAIAFGVVCALAHRWERLYNHRGVLLGISAGIWFGVADVSIKAVTSGDHGIWGFVGPWTWLGILCAVGAFFASARSFQIGEGIGVIAASTAAANLLGIISGILVFGEPLGNNPLTVGGRLLAFTLVVVALTLVPAPVRAEDAAREQELESVEEPRRRGRGAGTLGGRRARGRARGRLGISMTEVKASIDIDARREDVWGVVADVPRLGEWVTIHSAFEGSPPDTVEEGTRFKQKLALGGIDFEVEWTATDVAEAELLEWNGEGPAGSTARARYELSGEDKTTFTYISEFDLPGGKLGDLAGKAVEKSADDEAQESLQRLKRLVES